MSAGAPTSSEATTASPPDFALLDGNTAKWSLEDDANLVKVLSQISDNLTLSTKKVETSLDALMYDSRMAEVRLGNVFSSFLQLANTQFVENRVYEDIANEDKEKEDQGESDAKSQEGKDGPDGTAGDGDSAGNDPAAILARYKQALTFGEKAMNLFSLFADNAELPGGVEPEEDIYNEKPLPYVIGTREFMDDPLVGLGDE